jgi:hypothetical protein
MYKEGMIYTLFPLTPSEVSKVQKNMKDNELKKSVK